MLIGVGGFGGRFPSLDFDELSQNNRAISQPIWDVAHMFLCWRFFSFFFFSPVLESFLSNLRPIYVMRQVLVLSGISLVL